MESYLVCLSKRSTKVLNLFKISVVSAIKSRRFEEQMPKWFELPKIENIQDHDDPVVDICALERANSLGPSSVNRGRIKTFYSTIGTSVSNSGFTFTCRAVNAHKWMPKDKFNEDLVFCAWHSQLPCWLIYAVKQKIERCEVKAAWSAKLPLMIL